ncbi:MAG: lipid-A-disaccharide synthase [bacterium]
MNKKIFITAGETSGDVYGANLMKAMLKLNPDIEFIGFGGPEMQQSGLDSIADFNELSVMGFWEVAKKYSYFSKLLDTCKKLAIESDIDCFIGMDYPGFNLRLEKYLKSKGIYTFHYIAPQTWAWGKDREKNFKNSIDTLLTVLPFEKEYFANVNIQAEYIGHPLLEHPLLKNDPPKLDERQFKCAILAGSRKQELEHHIPVLVEVVKKLHLKYPDLKFATSIVNKNHTKYLKELEVNGVQLEFYHDSKLMMQECRFGIIKSGTSTLEAALSGLPFLAIYSTSYLTYLFAKRVLKVPSISLPNILLDSPVIREFIQYDFNSDAVFQYSMDLIENKSISNNLLWKFKQIRELLKCTESPSLTASHIILKKNFANK